MSLLARLLSRKSALESTLKAPSQDRPGINQSASGKTDSVAAITAMANKHFQSGDLNAARDLYNRVLEFDPENARAYYMLSGISVHDGDIASAIGLMHRAIARQPAIPEFHFSLAGVYLAKGLMDKALACYQEALRLKPDSLDYQRAMAGALMATGRVDEGVETYRTIARAGRPDGRAYFELGKALQLRGDLKEAEGVFAQAVSLSPKSEGVHLHLALVRREQGRPVDAEAPARQAVALAPEMYQCWFVLGGVLGDQGRYAEAVEHFRKVLAMQSDDEETWSAVLFSMNYSEQFSAHEVFEEHLKYGQLFPDVPPTAVDAARFRPGHRIRVGYLSPDFWHHPVAYFLAPILSHHDRHRFEVFCYHTGKGEDAMTTRLKTNVEHWRRMAEISDDDLERALRKDELDILVELSGHSDRHRLAVLAKRVAPVQVTYLGYPNTTGVAAIDYRITDARADPPGESDTLHVEKLIRLPETFLCYAPPAANRETPVAPVHHKGHITFASFNNLAKVSPITIKLWSRILAAVPGSRLLIKTRGLQDPGLRALLLSRFRDQGTDTARLAIMTLIPDHREHLQTYDQVDIALDPFPYHGTTTTLEALWMGVPVVTLQGDRHASRVGVSILSTLGLAHWVAQSENQYVEIAVALAADPFELNRLRQSLRSRLSQSPLTDGARFTAQLEEAYLQMCQETLTRSRPTASTRAAEV